MKCRLIIDEVTSDSRRYNVNRSISTGPPCNFTYPLSEDEGKIENVGDVGQSLVRRVLDIHGVEEVTLKPYQLTVYIGAAFGWKDIEPSIIDAFRVLLNEPEIQILEREVRTTTNETVITSLGERPDPLAKLAFEDDITEPEA